MITESDVRAIAEEIAARAVAESEDRVAIAVGAAIRVAGDRPANERGVPSVGWGTVESVDEDGGFAHVVLDGEIDATPVMLIGANNSDSGGTTGDSFWSYAAGTLQPDPATTTPLDHFSAAATTDFTLLAFVPFDNAAEVLGNIMPGVGGVANVIAEAQTQGSQASTLTLQADNTSDLAQFQASVANTMATAQLELDAGSFSLTADDGTTTYAFASGVGGNGLQSLLNATDVQAELSLIVTPSTGARFVVDCNGPGAESGTIDLNTGNLLISASNSIQVVHVADLPDDESWSGECAYFTYGESIAAGDVLYIHTDGTVHKADANASGKFPAVALALDTDSSGSHRVLLRGFYRNDALYGWSTIGATGVLWLSTTAGALTQIQPSGSGDAIQPIGYATHADRIYFDPDITWVTHA